MQCMRRYSCTMVTDTLLSTSHLQPTVHSARLLHLCSLYQLTQIFQKLIWGFIEEQGMRCKNCKRSVHHECYDKGVSRCVDNQLPLLEGGNVEVDTQFKVEHK